MSSCATYIADTGSCNHNGTTPVAIVVGSIVCLVCFLFLFLTAYYLCRRRQPPSFLQFVFDEPLNSDLTGMAPVLSNNNSVKARDAAIPRGPVPSVCVALPSGGPRPLLQVAWPESYDVKLRKAAAAAEGGHTVTHRPGGGHTNGIQGTTAAAGASAGTSGGTHRPSSAAPLHRGSSSRGSGREEGENGGVTDDDAVLWRGGLNRSSHSYGGGMTPDSTVHSVSSLDAALHWKGEIPASLSISSDSSLLAASTSGRFSSKALSGAIGPTPSATPLPQPPPAAAAAAAGNDDASTHSGRFMLGHAGSALRAWLAGSSSSSGINQSSQTDACPHTAGAESLHSQQAQQDLLLSSSLCQGEEKGEYSMQEETVGQGPQWAHQQDGQGQTQEQHVVQQQQQQQQSVEHVVTVREVQGEDDELEKWMGGQQGVETQRGRELERLGEGKCEVMHVCRSTSEPSVSDSCKILIGEESGLRVGGGTGTGQTSAGGSMRGGRWLSRSRNDCSSGLQEEGVDSSVSDTERGEGRQHGANWMQYLSRPSSRG